MQNLNHFINQSYPDLSLQIPFEAIELLSRVERSPCVFIKSKDRHFLFANTNCHYLFGPKIIGKTDDELTEDKKLISLYREYDNEVLNTEHTLFTEETVNPKVHRKVFKNVECTKYPLYIYSDKPNAILGIIFPKNELLTLKSEEVMFLSSTEINDLLTRRSYKVTAKNTELSFSKREIICFMGLFKGKQAGEIAVELNLKQITVESYIHNLKNKCNVTRRSELIDFFISNGILQQILV